jgi:hypothetical protein
MPNVSGSVGLYTVSIRILSIPYRIKGGGWGAAVQKEQKCKLDTGYDLSRNRPWSRTGLCHIVYTVGSQMAVRLIALRTGRVLLLVLIYTRSRVSPRA